MNSAVTAGVSCELSGFPRGSEESSGVLSPASSVAPSARHKQTRLSGDHASLTSVLLLGELQRELSKLPQQHSSA